MPDQKPARNSFRIIRVPAGHLSGMCPQICPFLVELVVKLQVKMVRLERRPERASIRPNRNMSCNPEGTDNLFIRAS